MMSVMLGIVVVVLAFAFWRFLLGEAGVLEHPRDYDGPIEGWWGQPIEEKEWL